MATFHIQRDKISLCVKFSSISRQGIAIIDSFIKDGVARDTFLVDVDSLVSHIYTFLQLFIAISSRFNKYNATNRKQE